MFGVLLFKTVSMFSPDCRRTQDPPASDSEYDSMVHGSV